ncbi:amino acid transporter [Microbacterium sp. X-17]|uniref:amino acid transporter n=1 Tax=Microbacterium sp. X-17 TaxID=3144404 RepID=UPI0031F55BB1
MNERPRRRELMKPVQLLGLAFAAAAFAFLVTLLSMGILQDIPDAAKMQALIVASVLGGSVFVVTLIGIALLLLAVDPADVTKTIDRPVLLPRDSSEKPEEKPEGREPGSTD